ncbi:MAG: hypothetical protein LLF83_07615 [Methanobacterium sp.]|nr:hypothetical protein [Methanobacterium sp.]
MENKLKLIVRMLRRLHTKDEYKKQHRTGHQDMVSKSGLNLNQKKVKLLLHHS